MKSLKKLCLESTDLSIVEIVQLEKLQQCLPLIADLTNADVFIDCLIKKQEREAIVVAQASPSQGISAYQNDIVGLIAEAKNEPAVFHALYHGMPVCDLKAVTQEGRIVRQNVAPIRSESDKVIGVLIREKDVSADIQHDKKYKELADNYEAANSVASMNKDSEQEILLREVHHRVKNNLQLIGSILNLQARKSDDPQIQTILKENVNRVLSVASIHDILIHISKDMQTVQSDVLFTQIRYNLQSLLPTNKKLQLEFCGDVICMDGDTAVSVALVVVELVMNSIRHAFHDRESGKITVTVLKGNLFHTITVADDGNGFSFNNQNKNGLGLSIVKSLVEEKLKGVLHIASNENGTKTSFDLIKE